MKKSDAQVAFYMSNIRQLLAIDPEMSLREMQEQLAQNNINIDINYLGRLRNKHLNARAHRIDRTAQKQALAQINDAMTETKRRMWPILLSKTSTNNEKIAAAAEIRDTYRFVYSLMQEAGIFDKKLGTIDVEVKVKAETDPRVARLVQSIESLWLPPKKDAERTATTASAA